MGKLINDIINEMDKVADENEESFWTWMSIRNVMEQRSAKDDEATLISHQIWSFQTERKQERVESSGLKDWILNVATSSALMAFPVNLKNFTFRRRNSQRSLHDKTHNQASKSCY